MSVCGQGVHLVNAFSDCPQSRTPWSRAPSEAHRKARPGGAGRGAGAFRPPTPAPSGTSARVDAWPDVKALAKATDREIAT